MRLTILGGCGAWPAAGQACSGYLVEHDDHRILIDPGYATLPRLLHHTDAHRIDAVLVSHGHPDHCADLNPLLRARALAGHPAPPLPVYAPPGALDAVLALDGPDLALAATTHHLTDGVRLTIGPFTVHTAALPHFVPNVGMRLTAGGATLAYTGDGGPDPALLTLADDADLLLAEATYPELVPTRHAGRLSSAVDAARQADQAAVGQLILTHLWPGTTPQAALSAARRHRRGAVDVATPGRTHTLG